MQKYIKKIIAALMCIAMLFSLCSCKDGKSVIDTISNLGKQTETTTIDEIGFTIPYMRTDSLNPYLAEETMNKYVASLMYDSLFTVNSDFEAIKVIADSYTVAGNELTVTIKSELKFTDGSNLTSADVVYSFEAAKESSSYTSLLNNISKATADGNNKVIFTLKTAVNDEAVNLTFPIIKELSDKAQDSTDADSTEESSKSQSKLPIGSGRYTYVSSSDSKYLQANTSRLGGYEPTYSKIGLSDVADSESLQSLFNLQQIDFYCDKFSDGKYGKFSNISSKIELTNLVYLGINSESDILSESKVRRAIALALDRTELVSDSYADCAVATSLPIHPSSSKLKDCTIPTLKIKTNSAVELLENAGYSKINDSGVRYSDDNKSLSITLLINNENEFRCSLARGIQQALEKVNIEVTIKGYSYSNYISAIEEENFDMYIGETELPNNFNLSKFFSESGKLRYGIDQNSLTATNYAAYLADESKLQTFIDSFSDELPFIPIAFRQGIAVSSDKITTDIVTSPDNGFYNVSEWTVE